MRAEGLTWLLRDRFEGCGCNGSAGGVVGVAARCSPGPRMMLLGLATSLMGVGPCGGFGDRVLQGERDRITKEMRRR